MMEEDQFSDNTMPLGWIMGRKSQYWLELFPILGLRLYKAN